MLSVRAHERSRFEHPLNIQRVSGHEVAAVEAGGRVIRLLDELFEFDVEPLSVKDIEVSTSSSGNCLIDLIGLGRLVLGKRRLASVIQLMVRSLASPAIGQIIDESVDNAIAFSLVDRK